MVRQWREYTSRFCNCQCNVLVGSVAFVLLWCVFLILSSWVIIRSVNRTTFLAYLTLAFIAGGIALLVAAPSDCGFHTPFVIPGIVLLLLAVYLGFVTWVRIPYEERGAITPSDPIVGLIRRIKFWWYWKNKKK